MASNIVGLRGERFNEMGVDEDVVGLAREILEQAKRGEIIGLAVIMLSPANEIGTRTCGHHVRHQLLAGTVYLQHDMANEE